MTITSDYTELRDKQQKVWSSGDYNKIAHITVPVSEHLVDHVGVMPSTHVLDVATGTGHVALAAARRGAVVRGMDYVPELLDIARRRADAEDLDIEFDQADAENLPYGDGSFDTVFSAIGVMFAADHARAAGELVRVARRGGRIALASWTPEGFVGGMLAAVGRHVSPPPGAQPATRWGVESVVAELLGDERRRRAVGDRHACASGSRSAEEFADLFLTYYGPTYSAANRLDENGRAAFRADLVALGRRPSTRRTGERASCATGSTASSPPPSADPSPHQSHEEQAKEPDHEHQADQLAHQDRPARRRRPRRGEHDHRRGSRAHHRPERQERVPHGPRHPQRLHQGRRRPRRFADQGRLLRWPRRGAGSRRSARAGRREGREGRQGRQGRARRSGPGRAAGSGRLRRAAATSSTDEPVAANSAIAWGADCAPVAPR